MRRASLLVVLALILTAPFFLTDAFVQAGPGKPAPPPTFSDSGPEPQLSRILVEIENNQLDKALQLTENLLQQYPKFRLAHLIKVPRPTHLNISLHLSQRGHIALVGGTSLRCGGQ